MASLETAATVARCWPGENVSFSVTSKSKRSGKPSGRKRSKSGRAMTKIEELRAENKELREDVNNLVGMMTNVVSMLLEIEIAYGAESGKLSAETSQRFETSAGIYHGYTQKKILDATSATIDRMSEDMEDASD